MRLRVQAKGAACGTKPTDVENHDSHDQADVWGLEFFPFGFRVGRQGYKGEAFSKREALAAKTPGTKQGALGLDYRNSKLRSESQTHNPTAPQPFLKVVPMKRRITKTGKAYLVNPWFLGCGYFRFPSLPPPSLPPSPFPPPSLPARTTGKPAMRPPES